MTEADYTTEPQRERPEIVYVPSKRVLSGDTEVSVEFRHLADGRLAVLAYTSRDALIANCGELQSWAALPYDRVPELRERSGADLVLWNFPLPAGERKDAAGETGGGT